MRSVKRNVLMLVSATAMLAGSLGFAAADNKELRINVGLPPTHSWARAYSFAEQELPKASGNTLTAKMFAGSLLNLKETVTGVRDGVVDMGLVITGYFPAEFREASLVNELAMLGESGIAMTGAASEYLMTCEECVADFGKFNQIYLGTAVVPVIKLMTTKPVKSVADLKGMKIRTGASAYSRWAEHFGASSSTLSANEVYEGMSQGVINGNMHPQTEIINLSLYTIAKYVTDMPIGTYNGTSTYSFNADAWRDLTNEQRAAVIDVVARGNAHVAMEYQKDADRAKGEAEAKGVTWLTPDADLVEATKAFIAEDIGKVAGLATASYGVQNAEAKVERFKELVVKWNGLTKDLGTDEAAFAALLKKEVFDRLDPATYGMK